MYKYIYIYIYTDNANEENSMNGYSVMINLFQPVISLFKMCMRSEETRNNYLKLN